MAKYIAFALSRTHRSMWLYVSRSRCAIYWIGIVRCYCGWKEPNTVSMRESEWVKHTERERDWTEGDEEKLIVGMCLCCYLCIGNFVVCYLTFGHEDNGTFDGVLVTRVSLSLSHHAGGGFLLLFHRFSLIQSPITSEWVSTSHSAYEFDGNRLLNLVAGLFDSCVCLSGYISLYLHTNFWERETERFQWNECKFGVFGFELQN